MDRPELADDPRFRTNVDRVRHRAETVALVQGVIGTRTCDDWVALLTALKVPCAPINSLADMLAHPHTLARGMVLGYDHPFLGELRTVAQPILFDGSLRAVRLPPPSVAIGGSSIPASPLRLPLVMAGPVPAMTRGGGWVLELGHNLVRRCC